MSDIHSRYKKYIIANERIIIIFSMFVVLFLVLIISIFILSVKHKEDFMYLSNENRMKNLILPPLRGQIVDRNGIQLTQNQVNYMVSISGNRKDGEEILNQLSEIVEISKRDKQKIIKKL
jgi:penicillin-binding protein 2